MKVLSLFDGISCGMVALERAGIPVERYVAYEIEPNAIKISKKNYPQIERCGDVRTADFSLYKDFDLLLAGFPCQDLSINTANRKGLKGERSGLFWEVVRAIVEASPKYFLIENNYKMPKEDLETITQTLKVQPILIDSGALSAQQRKRLYWTNIPNIEQPIQENINVIDILEKANAENLIDEVNFSNCDELCERQEKPVRIGTIGKGGQGERVYSVYGKSVTLTANGGGRGAKTGLYLINNTVRKLTPLEAERCQTLPDNYTEAEGITATSRLKVVGNGWTVDVIAHILSYLKAVNLNERLHS
jgi:DNA (cytosine-5)-methyltransferase 3A